MRELAQAGIYTLADVESPFQFVQRRYFTPRAVCDGHVSKSRGRRAGVIWRSKTKEGSMGYTKQVVI